MGPDAEAGVSGVEGTGTTEGKGRVEERRGPSSGGEERTGDPTGLNTVGVLPHTPPSRDGRGQDR